MTKNLTSWAKLKAHGIPDFIVIRRPLLWAGETIAVGATFPLIPNHARLRQLYEQRKIAPGIPSAPIVEETEASDLHPKSKKKKTQ